VKKLVGEGSSINNLSSKNNHLINNNNNKNESESKDKKIIDIVTPMNNDSKDKGINNNQPNIKQGHLKFVNSKK
jgi:hypothetical protein